MMPKSAKQRQYLAMMARDKAKGKIVPPITSKPFDEMNQAMGLFKGQKKTKFNPGY